MGQKHTDEREAMSDGKEWDLRERTLQFALRVIRLCAALPDTPERRLFRGQLLRSGTSPGAQYREACRARSANEFISKTQASLQELDETDYWLELIERSDTLPAARLVDLKAETNELIAIFSSSVKTAKANNP
jgi:four helix bundle protein